MTANLLEVTQGIDLWFVASAEFDGTAKTLKVRIDFKTGSGFAVSGHEGSHGVPRTLPFAGDLIR